jgi:hypothetical protein
MGGLGRLGDLDLFCIIYSRFLRSIEDSTGVFIVLEERIYKIKLQTKNMRCRILLPLLLLCIVILSYHLLDLFYSFVFPNIDFYRSCSFVFPNIDFYRSYSIAPEFIGNCL